MQGVSDVKVAARELLDRRPAKAVPGEVEQANRYPPIDSVRAAKVGSVGEAILPGARKEHQLVALGQQPRQRPGHLVCVLADPRSLDERGPVVEEDAHRGSMLAQGKNSQPLQAQ